MADNGIKLFILFYMMRELLRVMNILSRTLQITIRVYLGLPKKVTIVWMRPEQMTYPRLSWRKTTCLLLSTMWRKLRKMFYKWNTTKLQVRLASQQSLP
jgi:hypothetical protein